MRLHKQGLSIRAISRQISISRQTVRRYINAGEFPEIACSKRGSTVLSPYMDYLHAQWQAGTHNAAQLFREIRAQGYQGSDRLVRRWKAKMAAEILPASPLQSSPRQHKAQVWSANYAVRLLFKEQDTLTDKQQNALERMLNANSDVRQAYNFGQSFVREEGQVNQLKLIKRQIHGRAKFDLLRLRVLAPP